MLRNYELTVLTSSDLEEKEVDKNVKVLTEIFASEGAKINKKSDPLKKSLAYEISKKREGFYVYFELELESDKVSDLENKIKLVDNVIRYLLVKKS